MCVVKFSIGRLHCLKFVRLEIKAAKQMLPVVQYFKLCYLLHYEIMINISLKHAIIYAKTLKVNITCYYR